MAVAEPSRSAVTPEAVAEMAARLKELHPEVPEDTCRRMAEVNLEGDGHRYLRVNSAANRA